MIVVKYIHVTCAVLTIIGFLLRGVWMIRGSSMLQRTWVKVLPHVIDTVLLLSAIALAVNIHQYPGTHGWLTAKLAGLLAYIVLGSISLKRGPTKKIRVAAWAAALAAFTYIVAVAITRSPVLGMI